MKLKIKNRLPQAINLVYDNSSFLLKPRGADGDSLIVDKLTLQMKNLEKKWFIQVCKVNNKKKQL